jgi:hypothetical protein
MRHTSSYLTLAILALGCKGKEQQDPGPASKPVEPAAAAVPAAGAVRVPAAAGPASAGQEAAPAQGAASTGKKLVDLSTIKDQYGEAGAVNATIELPANATIKIETRTVNGELERTATVTVPEIEISPKHAEVAEATFEISKLPAPGKFEAIKASFKPKDIVRAEKDVDGHTFVTKVGTNFMVNIQRGTYLCASAGPEGHGVLDVELAVVVPACQSLRGK